MADIIFDRTANRLTRGFLITGQKNRLDTAMMRDFILLPALVSELLMRHDGVCFSVYGENMVAPVLVKSYGTRAISELLEQGAVKFHLQSSAVMHTVSEVKGLNPLASAKQTQPVHTDPEASVAEGLSRLSSPPPEAELKRLRQRFAEAYVTPSEDFAPQAAKLAQDGYQQGRFSELGLKFDRPLGDLVLEERAKLSVLADEVLNLSLIADLKMESLDNFEISQVFQDSMANLARATKVRDAEAQVFRIENVPSLRILFASGVLLHENVASLRNTRDAVRFREWLRSTAATTDALEITKEYLDAVTQKHNFYDSVGGKIAKSVGIVAASSAVGAVLAGPPGD
jgi:hypothetical protein